MASKRYYTLLVRENKDAPWTIAFGDYDRATVAQEADDSYWDKNTHPGYRRQDMKIVATGDDQASIKAAVDALNGKGA